MVIFHSYVSLPEGMSKADRLNLYAASRLDRSPANRFTQEFKHNKPYPIDPTIPEKERYIYIYIYT